MFEKVYFGTYTRKNSQGIYQAELDTKQGQINNLKLFIDDIVNPTYLTTYDKIMLTIASNNKNEGGVAVYDISGQPSLIDENLSEGAAPCYISFDKIKNLVYVANYHKGLVEVYHLNHDNKLSLTDSVLYVGNGPKPEQDTAHAHFANLAPDNRLITIDLGSDKVYSYKVSSSGKLSDEKAFSTPAGFGPRHIVFNSNNRIAYLAGELSSELAVLSYKNGKFNQIQVISTIPDNWNEHNGVAAIRISSDNRFVYVSNRGHNSISVFQVNKNDTLKLIQTIATNGDFPRDFALNTSEKFLLVAHQNSSIASLFSRDSSSGKLKLLQTNIPVPEGVCVHFYN